jgi:uncharacterized protein YdaU (DUF1376 family)
MSSPKRRIVSAMPWSFSDVLTKEQMHYYQFNIGDYLSHTKHLDLMEDLAYRRLLDIYYLHERPLNSGIASVARQIGMRDHENEVKSVLEEFFNLSDDGWINHRADKEIKHYHSKIDQASRAGKASAERRMNTRSTGVQPTNNQEPITINHIVDNTTEVVSKPKVSKRGTRLPIDWVLPTEWKDWAKAERPDLFIDSVADQFCDFWVAKTGPNATKLDWQATWRNWVRNQKALRLNPADVARTTVPCTVDRDPTLVQLDEQHKKWKPPAPEILEKMKALKGKVYGVNDNKGENP